MGPGQGSALIDGAWLAWSTPARWVERVVRRPLDLLADHAHCELKAAATSQSLIARHPGEGAMLAPLAELAREELAHFAVVHAVLAARGGVLGPPRPSPYAAGLARAARADPVGGGGSREPLLDRLLVAGLIEARSLERFDLLARCLSESERRDAELARLYAELRGSEARHRALFTRLARARFGDERVERRAARLRVLEARCIAGLPFDFRMHSGPGEEGG